MHVNMSKSLYQDIVGTCSTSPRFEELGINTREGKGGSFKVSHQEHVKFATTCICCNAVQSLEGEFGEIFNFMSSAKIIDEVLKFFCISSFKSSKLEEAVDLEIIDLFFDFVDFLF